MIDKRDQRLRILEFFSTIKLNKNCYSEGFYENRDALDVFKYLQTYFDYHPILSSASLAQRLYHIKNDTDVIPDKKFINYVMGYNKGRRVKNDPRWILDPNKRNSDWFFDELENYNICADNEVYSISEFIQKLKSLFKRIRYQDIIKDYKLINSIYRYSSEKDIPVKNYILGIVYDSDFHCPICGKSNSIYSLRLQKTCGDDVCVRNHMSILGKNRDYTILHTPKVRQLAFKTRRENGPWHTENTKRLISESNKNSWTSEKRDEIVRKNRENGVYEKFSIDMKNKILNGTFTPNTTNRLTHKRLSSEITGIKKYRSNWELKYHETYPQLKYETIRIPYTLNGKHHVYIVDFEDDINNILIEIKPSSMRSSDKVKAKELAAEEWCVSRGYKYNIITEHEFNFK